MKQLLMDISPFMARTALVEDGRLSELLVDTTERVSRVGNIYAAYVSDVQKNGFAFLDIGEGKKGLLQLSDHRQRGLAKVSQGSRLIVQVLRDETGGKGPMLSTTLSFPGRFLVLMKNPDEQMYVRTSGKITDPILRDELKNRCSGMCPEGFAIILRTAVMEATCEELHLEVRALHEKARKILETGRFIKPPMLLQGDEKIYGRSLKELLDTVPNRIVLNDEAELSYIKNTALNYIGMGDVSVHKGGLSIFETYGISTQVDKALHQKIWLSCGGFILIEESAACTYIDVNTGKCPGKRNFEEMAKKVNNEAANEIAASIRLKNLSGLIIVDFINSRNDELADELKSNFSMALLKDRTPAVITDWSALNIVQLTRKRSRIALSEILTEPCGFCGGSGAVKSPAFFADKIYKEIIKIYLEGFYDRIAVSANEDIAVLMKKTGLPTWVSVSGLRGKPQGFYEILKTKSSHEP